MESPSAAASPSMAKETKFGYGFLLAGAGLPYLIDKLLGPVAAVIAATICFLAGIGFLVAGHLHDKNKSRKRRGLMATIGMFALVGAASGAVIGSIAGAIWNIAQKKEPPVEVIIPREPVEKPTENPPKKAPEQSDEVKSKTTNHGKRKPQPSVEPPKIQQVVIAETKEIASRYQDAPYGVQLIITTTAKIDKIKLSLMCDVPVKHTWPPGYSGFIGGVASGEFPEADNRIYTFAIFDPPFTPQYPISVMLFGDQPIRNCQILNWGPIV